MAVGALDIHVMDTVVGAVVLDAGARAQPAAPHAPVARSGLRLGFAQGALVDLLVETIDMTLAAALFARADRRLVGGEFREPRSETRIDIFVEHFGAGVDVRVDVVDAKSVFHSSPPPRSSPALSHRGAGIAYQNCGATRLAQADLSLHSPSLH